MRTRLLLVCLLVGATAEAQRYVWKNGSHDGSFLTWETAATNIQAAVDAAGLDEVIHVTNGTYYSTGGLNNASVSITKRVRLVSVNGRDVTIIDGNYPAQTNRCLYITDAGAVVDGFTIRNGFLTTGIRGAGVLMTQGQVINCTIEANTNSAYWGGGVSITGGSMTNCVIRDNYMGASWGYGGGVYMGGGAMTNCTISGNRVHTYSRGAGIHIDSGHLKTCTISGNSGTSGWAPGVSINIGSVVGCAIVSNTTTVYNGGGLYVGGANVTVSDCDILWNAAGNGGGVYMVGGILTNCHVAWNTCANNGDGGGLYASAGRIQDCTVNSNYASGTAGRYGAGVFIAAALMGGGAVVGNTNGGYGGGVYLGANAELDGVLIAANSSKFSGGGVYIGGTNSIVKTCKILDNRSASGGGLQVYASHATVSTCTIRGNSASGQGGGVYFYNYTPLLIRNSIVASNTATGEGGGLWMNAAGRLESCLVAGNVAGAGGGGLWVQSGSPPLVNCTIAYNTSSNNFPGGVMSWGTVVLTNSIVRDNVYAGANIYSNWGFGGVQMAYSCTWPTNGLTSPGNINQDPGFVNVATGDYRLAKGSPCIDTGITLAGMSDAVDLAGQPRVVNGLVDMGAYEYVPPMRGAGTLISIR